jgi:DNA-directed RNA polymerase subunit RPC12/RpoP
MDRDFFEAWLDVIRCLTAEQRSVGFRALALAEAADGEEPVSFAPPAIAGMSVLAMSGGPAAGETDREGVGAETSNPPDTAVVAASTPEAVSLTAAAQHKVDVTGCPHCAGRVLQRWGYASGLPRYRCGACRRSSNAGADHWREPGQGGETVRCRRHHGVPLAAPVSFGAGARQTQPAQRDCRS